MTHPASSPSIPKPRLAPPSTRTAEPLPRHWFRGLALPTHVSNGVNLLFPAGERFFVRSVKRFEARITDPTLRARMRGFYGQEGFHTKAHEDAIEVLREQGYEVDRFLRGYEWFLTKVLERLSPPGLCLAGTAAAEHFTAIMARGGLLHQVLDDAHPRMRDLLLWHAAEEIEHKSVAFDVLRAVAPGYGLRMAGLAVATGTLAGAWLIGALSLLAQEDERFVELWRKARAARRDDRAIWRDVFVAGILAYVRPDFHPDDEDDADIASACIERLYGAAEPA